MQSAYYSQVWIIYDKEEDLYRKSLHVTSVYEFFLWGIAYVTMLCPSNGEMGVDGEPGLCTVTAFTSDCCKEDLREVLGR